MCHGLATMKVEQHTLDRWHQAQAAAGTGAAAAARFTQGQHWQVDVMHACGGGQLHLVRGGNFWVQRVASAGIGHERWDYSE